MQDEIKSLLSASLNVEHIEAVMEGNHCHLLVVSAEFDGLSPVKRQQKIYQCLGEKIESGEIHAVHIRAITPAQWESGV